MPGLACSEQVARFYPRLNALKIGSRQQTSGLFLRKPKTIYHVFFVKFDVFDLIRKSDSMEQIQHYKLTTRNTYKIKQI